MNKGELMELVLLDEERRKTDSAIPYQWSNKVSELGIDEMWRFCISYHNAGAGGKVVDLTQRFYEMFEMAPKLLKACRELIQQAKDREDCWEFGTPHDEMTDKNMIVEYWRVNELIKLMDETIEKLKDGTV